MQRRIIVALLAFAVLPAFAHAQASTDPLLLSISPANPKPYDTVTVTPDSDVLDLSHAKITVSSGSTVIEDGGGVQSVPVPVAGPGGATTITVKASVGGQTYTKSVTIRPADVSLVVEPITSTHPFYLGAALTAPQSRVRVIALPDLRTSPNVRLNPATLSYQWKLGDQILAESSGIGRSTLIATAPMRYRDAQLTVTVTSPDGGLIASAATVISPVDPVLRLYRSDPLMGPLFDQALSGTYTMTGDEEAFRGVAYFFGNPPALSWAVNGEPASSDQTVTVRTTGSGAGSASLSLSAKDASTLQSLSTGLSVAFGAKKTNNIFGF